MAVCAIFRDEAPFLREWIEFHTGIGADHFYIYNNFSSDDYLDVISPWVEAGIITLVDWPRVVGQLSAYRDCLRRARLKARWLAFIDLDEFLFSPASVDITPILETYADLPGIEVWQTFFGSSGHVARPGMRVTEAYTLRAPLSRTTVKTIANPRLVYRPGVHQSKYWLGHALDTSRQQVTPDRAPVLDVLRINHYWSRSLQDLDTKIARGDASTSQPRDRDWHFAFERTLNTERDTSILPIAAAIHRTG